MDISTTDNFEQLERFQSLSAGQYWRVKTAFADEGVPFEAGTTLLIQSLRWVDNQVHTVILRAHPSVYKQSFRYTYIDDDGRERSHTYTHNEYRFLLKDFLSCFEYEPDHKQIRRDEVSAIQGKVQSLQNELIETQADPAKMKDIVYKALSEERKEKGGTDLPVVQNMDQMQSDKMTSLAVGSLSDALAAGITEDTVEQMKAVADKQYKVATIQSKWIQSKTNEIAQTIKEMTPFYEELAAAALAQTEDVREYVDDLMKGIQSLDLYIGKGVEVETIAEGESADKAIPLTLVQQKLVMDEELAAWVDVDESFDFSSADRFFSALREHDGLVNQIFPTQRCILVMATTRRMIDYGDPLISHHRNRANQEVFLLIRNGGNLHRVFSPVESHLGSARLFPSKNEHDAIFRGFHGEDISFEDVAYTDRLSEYERMSLHYKRFLIMLCGLDHREKLLGEFYAGPADFSFVSLDFQEKHFHFLHDEDGEGLLGGQRRPQVEQWIQDKNAFLKSGSRVACLWDDVLDESTAPAAFSTYSNGSSHQNYHPRNDMDVMIVGKKAGDMTVGIDVSGRNSNYDDRSFTCNVNLSHKLRRSSQIGLLCLDRVRAEELEAYIYDRKCRIRFLNYIRLFKLALKHVREEEARQEATRRSLLSAMEEGRVAKPELRENIVDTSISLWRSANAGAMLPGIKSLRGKVSKTLFDLMYALAEKDTLFAEARQEADKLDQALLRISVAGNAKFYVYVAPKTDEQNNLLEPHAWALRYELVRGKTNNTLKNPRWASLVKFNPEEQTLLDTKLAEDWCRSSLFSSLKKKEETLQAVDSAFKEGQKWLSGELDALEIEDVLEKWDDCRDAVSKKYVSNPSWILPVGMVSMRGALNYLCLCIQDVPAYLYHLTDDKLLKNNIKETFISSYASKNAARDIFGRDLERIKNDRKPWIMTHIPVKQFRKMKDNFTGEPAYRLFNMTKWHPGLNYDFNNWVKETRHDYWLLPALYDQDQVNIDRFLSLADADPDLNPIKVRTMNISAWDETQLNFNTLYDVATLFGTEMNNRHTLGELSKMKEKDVSSDFQWLALENIQTHSHEETYSSLKVFLADHASRDYDLVPATEMDNVPLPERPNVIRFVRIDKKFTPE